MTKISRDAAKVFGEAYGKVPGNVMDVARKVANKRKEVLKKIADSDKKGN